MHLCGGGAIAELEQKLRRHYSMDYALCVSSAGLGLLACALAMGLKKAEFVTTPYTYGASLGGWLFLGNKPVFADVDPHTLTVDGESIRRVVGPKTKALLAVDIYGVPADTVALRKVADELGLWYIADAAQSLGASRQGLPASGLADALVVSFTTGKSVFAGEGGAVLTNNADLYQKMVWYTQHPFRQRSELGLSLDNEFAINARIHPLAAVWANATFDLSLEKLKSHQRACFKVIDALNAIRLTEPIHFAEEGVKPSFFRLTAAWKNGQARPDQLVRALRNRHHHVALQDPPVRLVHRQPAFLTQYGACLKTKIDCPQADSQSRHRFSLTAL